MSILLLSFFSCKTTDGVKDGEKAGEITAKLDSVNYTFVPQTAYPMIGNRSIQLDKTYSLKITKDTIESYLPYFGRAYTAPIFPDDSGIKFVSTDFTYKVNKKKDMWNITIETKDTKQKTKLYLNIGSGGYASLSVQDNSRQSISFYGLIE